MHIVPKPDGYELRDKRSDKTKSASDWSPRDALYAASERMGENAESVTVIWREKTPDGAFAYHRSNAGPRGSTLDLTVTALGVEMGWTR